MEAAGLVNCAPTAKTAGTREKKIQESKDDFLACTCVGLAAMPRVYTFSFNPRDQRRLSSLHVCWSRGSASRLHIFF